MELGERLLAVGAGKRSAVLPDARRRRAPPRRCCVSPAAMSVQVVEVERPSHSDDSTPPPAGQVGVDPRSGKLTGRPVPNAFTPTNPDTCERDRATFGLMNDEDEFRHLLDEANTANASFYPVDPRGLVVFDEALGKAQTGVR